MLSVAAVPLIPSALSGDIYEVGGRDYCVEWRLNETFDSDGWASRWTVESQGSTVVAEEGMLRIRRNGVDKATGGVTVWYDEDLPKNVLIVVDASTAPGDHACNLNFFIHASEADGSPLIYGRSAEYKLYHEIPNYLFTLTGGFMDGWARGRRNPGFVLVHEDKSIRVESGQRYEITIVVDDGQLSYYLNGKLIHRYVDEDPLPGGRLGLRSWFSDIDFDRIRIAAIVE
ncbi:DUF6250 domain-containing protein [Ruficoccus sp. ZRK36]|uniref:DUF6250 domain-containing protein n=1 Tax=Ruficoccus sp. ZRK36 TaxID=2866311 RepID=UPI001C73070C|nr:DUF6250 domain-containing protein [Ruficoccus sp. ZRK36]QYY37409.1 DUF1080 domain-containing protein [Ruficoccus sp. ZRK36]